MNYRRDRREFPDELDRLVTAALHDMVRTAEPSPRIWQNIRAAVIAERRRRETRPRTGVRAVLEGLSSWLTPAPTNRCWGTMMHGVRFADVGGMSPCFLWWSDVDTGPWGSGWQTRLITT